MRSVFWMIKQMNMVLKGDPLLLGKPKKDRIKFFEISKCQIIDLKLNNVNIQLFKTTFSGEIQHVFVNKISKQLSTPNN